MLVVKEGPYRVSETTPEPEPVARSGERSTVAVHGNICGAGVLVVL